MASVTVPVKEPQNTPPPQNTLERFGASQNKIPSSPKTILHRSLKTLPLPQNTHLIMLYRNKIVKLGISRNPWMFQ